MNAVAAGQRQHGTDHHQQRARVMRCADGHQTNAWLSRFVELIENWPRP